MSLFKSRLRQAVDHPSFNPVSEYVAMTDRHLNR